MKTEKTGKAKLVLICGHPLIGVLNQIIVCLVPFQNKHAVLFALGY